MKSIHVTRKFQVTVSYTIELLLKIASLRLGKRFKKVIVFSEQNEGNLLAHLLPGANVIMHSEVDKMGSSGFHNSPGRGTGYFRRFHGIPVSKFDSNGQLLI